MSQQNALQRYYRDAARALEELQQRRAADGAADDGEVVDWDGGHDQLGGDDDGDGVVLP